VAISESGQPNGRPYRACTTNVRQAKARGRTGAAAARGKRKKRGGGFARYWGCTEVIISFTDPFRSEQEFEDTREKSEKSEIFLKLSREGGKQKMLIFHWPVSWGEITDWNYFETTPSWKGFQKGQHVNGSMRGRAIFAHVDFTGSRVSIDRANQ